MTDTTLAINALQNDSYLQGMRQIATWLYFNYKIINVSDFKSVDNFDGFKHGYVDMRKYMFAWVDDKSIGMEPMELIKEIQRAKLSHDARKLEPYRKSEAMLQMREIAQEDMEHNNE